MSYVKTVWKDLPDRTTPITAARLNNAETQYDNGMADFGVGVSVKAHGAVGDGVADDTVAIQTAITAASGKSLFFPPGSYKIAGNLNVPENTVVVGSRATITQTAVNTIAMTITTGCSVQGIDFVGRGAAGYNASSETSEICLLVSNATGATVRDCKITGVASAGIKVQGSTDVKVTRLTIVGPGSPTIAAGDGVCYGVYVDNSSRVTVTDCDISELCQGVISSITVTDFVLADSTIYNIRGQHGFYLQNGNGLKVSGLNIYTTNLNGGKVQIIAASTSDSTGMSITDVTVRGSGSDAIILQNTDTALTYKFAHVSISGIVASNCNRGVNVRNVRGGTVSDIFVFNATADAVTITDCWDLTVSNINVNIAGQNGIRVGTVTNGSNQRLTISDTQIRNPGQANVASNQYGIFVQDAADLTIDNLVVTATNTTMVHGLFFAAGDQATFTLMNSDISGSTAGLPVSVRGLAADMKRWHNNKLSGTIQNITGLTTTTAPAAGGAGALPATPLGYYKVNVAGVDRQVAFYA